ncbi:hypothetical protein ACI797_21945 [Geodermatophilus sp. SYSU D00691]
MSRLLRAAVPAGVALLLAGCAGTAPPPARADPTSSSPGTTSSVTASAEPSARAQVVEVAYRGGQVGGGGRIPVELGTAVTLQVTSDVADHVHVHGYDLMADVAPDAPGTVTFEATVPGVFEVELEERGQELLSLQVR